MKVFTSMVMVLVPMITSAAPLPVPAEGGAAAPNCSSLLSQSLPECQERTGGQPHTYANFGEVWGEITVDVSSPVLIITEPDQRKKKRRNKNRNKNKLQV